MHNINKKKGADTPGAGLLFRMISSNASYWSAATRFALPIGMLGWLLPMCLAASAERRTVLPTLADAAVKENEGRIVVSYTPQMMRGCASAGSGGDDTVCIQAAISAAAQAYGGTGGPNAGLVYFPYPSSGHYNICSDHIALPGGSSAIRLEGVAGGGSSIRIMPGCASPPKEVLYQRINTTQLSQSRVSISDLTIDAFGLSTYDINLQYAVGFSAHNTVLRNAARGGANLYIKGGYEIEFGASNRIENINDAGHIIYFTSADLPAFGLETYGTDSYFDNLIINDAYQAYAYQGNGGNNHFTGTHGWGYPRASSGTGGLQQDFRAKYAFQAKGNAQFIGTVADNFTTAAFFLQSKPGNESGASVINSYVFGPPAGSCGVLLDSGVQHAIIIGNYFSKIPESSSHGVCSVGGVIDPTNIILGNQGLSTSSNFAVGLVGGDSLALTGLPAGYGAQLKVNSPNPNSSLYLSAKGAGGVNISANGATVAGFSAPSASVNRLAIVSAITGSAPQVRAVGADTDVDLELLGQGSGGISIAGPVKHAVASDVAASGTSQMTATALMRDISVVTTVSSGAGVVLQSNIGQRQEIFNRGANPLAVYPPSGAQIENREVNAAIYLGIGSHATFECVSKTQCYHAP